MKVAIVGYGVVGEAYGKLFPDCVKYDPFRNQRDPSFVSATKEEVNACDLAIVAVFTAHQADGSLDCSTVEEVIDWIETPLILIKSALQPGTTDKLIAKTGKKIAVSVENIGEGTYFIPYWKYPDVSNPAMHQMLVVGGERETAEKCAEILWSRMSPDIKIHIVSALEAEITKLVENSYGALKVTFINTLMTLAQKSNASFIKVHQAWQADPRTDSMHLRAVTYNRGWRSKCWDKDIPALVNYSNGVGATDLARLFQLVFDLNQEHLALNK